MALILIDNNGMCFCSCADSCVVKQKAGMMRRCTKKELNDAGHHVAELYDERSNKAIRNFYVIDGKEKKLKIRVR